MNHIQIIPAADQREGARLGVPPTELDVLAAESNEFLGVIEWLSYGYMFTDTFGHQTEFLNGEDLPEVFDAVSMLFNPETVN